MKYTAGTAAKAVGKTKSTITKAIASGKLSAIKNSSGAWEIDASELFRVYTPIALETVEIERMETPKETPINNSGLEREVELLREMLDETKADRDSWKSQAQKVTALIENQSAKKGFWARLMGG
jgi:hypothetical protein